MARPVFACVAPSPAPAPVVVKHPVPDVTVPSCKTIVLEIVPASYAINSLFKFLWSLCSPPAAGRLQTLGRGGEALTPLYL